MVSTHSNWSIKQQRLASLQAWQAVDILPVLFPDVEGDGENHVIVELYQQWGMHVTMCNYVYMYICSYVCSSWAMHYFEKASLVVMEHPQVSVLLRARTNNNLLRLCCILQSQDLARYRVPASHTGPVRRQEGFQIVTGSKFMFSGSNTECLWKHTS